MRLSPQALGHGWVSIAHPGPSSCCPQGNPTGAQTSKLARRVCADLPKRVGDSSGCSATTAASSVRPTSAPTLAELGVRHILIRAGRPQTNGHVEALHRLIPEECGDQPSPATSTVRFTGLMRDLAQYVDDSSEEGGDVNRGQLPDRAFRPLQPADEAVDPGQLARPLGLNMPLGLSLAWRPGRRRVARDQGGPVRTRVEAVPAEVAPDAVVADDDRAPLLLAQLAGDSR
jgi:hypothetical protein